METASRDFIGFQSLHNKIQAVKTVDSWWFNLIYQESGDQWREIRGKLYSACSRQWFACVALVTVTLTDEETTGQFRQPSNSTASESYRKAFGCHCHWLLDYEHISQYSSWFPAFFGLSVMGLFLNLQSEIHWCSEVTVNNSITPLYFRWNVNTYDAQLQSFLIYVTWLFLKSRSLLSVVSSSWKSWWKEEIVDLNLSIGMKVFYWKQYFC